MSESDAQGKPAFALPALEGVLAEHKANQERQLELGKQQRELRDRMERTGEAYRLIYKSSDPSDFEETLRRIEGVLPTLKDNGWLEHVRRAEHPDPHVEAVLALFHAGIESGHKGIEVVGNELAKHGPEFLSKVLNELNCNTVIESIFQAEDRAEAKRRWREEEAKLAAEASGLQGESTNAQGAAKRKRRGRKKADYETVQKEAELAADWERARDAGIYKPDFAKDKNMTVRQLDALLDRVAKRKRPSE
jgi:hypothetical protein